MFRVPSSVVVRRPISLGGKVVPVGTALSKDQIVALGHNLNALLDSGYVVASPDINARRDTKPRPSSLPPVIRKALLGKVGPVREPLAVDAKAVGRQVSVSVSGGVQPFTVSTMGQEQTKSSRTFAFTVNGVGTHTATVTDGSGGTASDNYTIVVAEDAPKAAKSKKGD